MESLRQARNPRIAAHASAPAWAGTSAITLRIATPEDDSRIARLAALDSARPPAPPVLTAELDGEICVAVSLTDLHTVADPFRLTLPVQAIARARADQLRGAAPPQARRLGPFGARRRTADRSPRPQSAI
jgi:hypothetical protein